MEYHSSSRSLVDMELVFEVPEIERLAWKLAPSKDVFKLVMAELLICSHFKQLAQFNGGFVGWLRWPDSMKESLKQGAYPMEKIEAYGPLLQIVSLYAPDSALKATRWLTKLNGVKTVCGNTLGKWREVICPNY